MSNPQHPITPPPDKLHNWCQELKINGDRVDLLLIKAARWGADQELEACCQWISDDAEALRIVRRPKPPSLAEEAMKELDSISCAFRIGYGGDLVCDTIRRALEKLQQLENNE